MARKNNYKAYPTWTGTLVGTQEILFNPGINNTDYKILLSDLLTYINNNVTVSVDTISEKNAGSGVTVDSVLLKDGGITVDGSGIISSVSNAIVPVIKAVAQGNITAGTGGAIPITNYLTTINTDAGGDAFTLADGDIIGMLKKILLVVDGGGDAVITPVNLADGTTITMNDATDYVILMWNGTDWVVIENFGSTIA